MSKVWTINVQVNTLYLSTLNETGTWKSPVGSSRYWRDNVRMSAISDDPSDKITVGTGDSFELSVGKDDVIKWVVSEVNPLYKNHRSVCMYGFKEGENWEANLTPPNTIISEAAFVSMQNGFNAPSPPVDAFLTAQTADESIPQTTVRAAAKSSRITYYMRLLLLDISSIRDVKILNYIQIDPVINIKL